MHLTKRQLKSYVRGTAGPDERPAIESHLNTCSVCRDRMLDEGSMSFDDDEAYPRRMKLIAGVSMGALCLVVVVALFFWTRQNLAPTGPSAASASTPEIQIRDGNGYIGLTPDGRLDSTYTVPEKYIKPVQTVLHTEHFDVPKVIAGLPASYEFAASRKPGDFRVLSPIGTAVISNTPTLVWEPVADSTAYIVEIKNGDQTVVTSPRLFDTHWETPKLDRGVLYSWRVSAIRQGETIRSALPRGRDAQFLVLDNTQARALDELLQNHPSEHLLLATAFAGAGVLDRADAEVKTLEQNNSRVQLVHDLRANLHPE